MNITPTMEFLKAGKRLCAICGKPRADLGFRTALRLLGVPTWEHDKAHVGCVRKLQKREINRRYAEECSQPYGHLGSERKARRRIRDQIELEQRRATITQPQT